MDQDKRYSDRAARRDRVSGGESASNRSDGSPAAREEELVEHVRALEAERDSLMSELDALRAQQPLLDALGSIVEAIVIYDADGRLVVCNENFRNLYGYTEEEARPGVHFSELGRIDIERGNVAVGDQYGDGEAYLARKAEYRRKLEGSFIVRLRDGRWIKTIDRPVRGGGFASIQVDITEIKALEENMRHMAQHDALTGLPNRRLLMEQGSRMAAAARRDGTRLAMLFVDIDYFKQVNDTLGHRAGDQLLVQLGARMRERLRSSDVVARLGGDEFVALVRLADIAGARQVADDLIRELSRPCRIEGREVYVTASIGIAYFPDQTEDLEELLRLSDGALYGAKDAGRSQWKEAASPTTGN